MEKTLKFTYKENTIQDLRSLFEDGQLNLNPSFQRQSVWNPKDRKGLILSIIEGYPIPSIFLYKYIEKEQGQVVYDVLDGKQRLESILKFIGVEKFEKDTFSVKCQMDDASDKLEEWSWARIVAEKKQYKITGYNISIIEVELEEDGSLSDIINLFVRINSTGKGLTSQERRQANYYSSQLLKKSFQVAEKNSQYFKINKIITEAAKSRMKDVELVCELLASISQGGIINKKSALDKIIKGDNLTSDELKDISNEFNKVLTIMNKVFPNIKSTRFKNTSEFYSLFMLIWEFYKTDMVLIDKERNAQAQEMIYILSNGVDTVRNKIKDAKGAETEEQIFVDYLSTTSSNTDGKTTRIGRKNILTKFLSGIFEEKDTVRAFSEEQRRILWNTSKEQKCSSCSEELTWENFTIDHKKAHSKGGKTNLSNADLMCRVCNSKKGNKSKK